MAESASGATDKSVQVKLVLLGKFLFSSARKPAKICQLVLRFLLLHRPELPGESRRGRSRCGGRGARPPSDAARDGRAACMIQRRLWSQLRVRLQGPDTVGARDEREQPSLQLLKGTGRRWDAQRWRVVEEL